MINAIYPCPVSFYPSVKILPPSPVSFCPPHHFAPWKWFNDLCCLPMSLSFYPSVSFCPRIILPPGNGLMIYAISPCPVSYCPLHSFFTHIILPPIILPPRNLLMYTIYPCPISFCPHIILPPGNCFMIYTIYPCPVSFCPLDSFCPNIILPLSFCPPWKWFNDLHYMYLPMSRIILPPALDFVFILIKSPLQLKLMTGAHPVTVAPLVFYLRPCTKKSRQIHRKQRKKFVKNDWKKLSV